MRICSIGAVWAVLLGSAQATTLEKLSLDEMIRQSTAIVHAKVTSSAAALHGQDVYTFYQLNVIETLKAAASPSGQVAIAGGTAAGKRQMVAGAPELNTGGEYVIFLWTSKSGLTQIMGMSQGLFTVMKDQSGNLVLVRPALAGAMLVDKAGQVQSSSQITISLSDLKTEIQRVMGAAK